MCITCMPTKDTILSEGGIGVVTLDGATLKMLLYTGNFQGIQFLQIGDLYRFADLNFADKCTRAHYALYNPWHILWI